MPSAPEQRAERVEAPQPFDGIRHIRRLALLGTDGEFMAAFRPAAEMTSVLRGSHPGAEAMFLFFSLAVARLKCSLHVGTAS